MNATVGLSMTKSLTIAYILAVMAIAASSLVAHGLLNRVIARTQTANIIINISGKQRMLSQRIDLFANKVMDGDKAAIPILKSLIGKFEEGDQAIILQNGELELSTIA
ncbi:MAG: type IV pili methyl-accepting chemotaxis transducer N-terminal domain-containing protein [Methylophilaceae bacterium]|nr:type IV pili methyl-accepting chemotaxis transducer N-terminal domain-containing protein [Methylophilaceae bacterium]